MIRIHFLQFVTLSDPICEEKLHESFASRCFIGLTMDSKRPYGTSIMLLAIFLRKIGFFSLFPLAFRKFP